jgi:hypothetical protein
MFGAWVLVGHTIHVPFLLYGGSLVGLTLEWTDLFDSGHGMAVLVRRNLRFMLEIKAQIIL